MYIDVHGALAVSKDWRREERCLEICVNRKYPRFIVFLAKGGQGVQVSQTSKPVYCSYSDLIGHESLPISNPRFVKATCQRTSSNPFPAPCVYDNQR